MAACQKDEVQAEQSIEGEWQVQSVISEYGSFPNGSFISSEQINEELATGIFNFTSDEVDYEFTRNDTVYSSITTWNMTSEKVNAGFTRVRKYTLEIGDRFIFDVFFGDGTSNSEKDATKMALTQDPMQSYPVSIFLELEKK